MVEKEEIILEKYFGCECGDLNHISRFSRLIKIEEDDDNVIYFAVKTINYLDRILPPFNFYRDDWCGYFRFHILRRIPIAIKYIFNSNYIKKWGIGDCFDFQDKNLISIKDFLLNLTKEENKEDINSIIYINNEEWRIRLYISQLDKDFPFWVGWDIQFLPRNLFGRIHYALKYIFGTWCDEQHFEIIEEKAKRFRGLITAVENLNKKDGEKKNDSK